MSSNYISDRSHKTIADVLDRYMKEISPNLAPTTDFRNSQMVKNFKAFFGEVLLKDVSSSLVSRYKALCLDKGFSRKTVLRELGLLRRVFNIAIGEWDRYEAIRRGYSGYQGTPGA